MGGVTGYGSPPRNGEGEWQVAAPPGRGLNCRGQFHLPLAKRGGGGAGNLRRPEVYLARKLRREMSLPEILVWQRVKGGKTGLKFRRQHPIGPYVADFYCSSARLVVEVDGEAHERGNRPADDESRDAFMVENGNRVLRIAAADILRDADTVVEGIVAFASSPLHRDASRRGPPPRSGEEL